MTNKKYTKKEFSDLIIKNAKFKDIYCWDEIMEFVNKNNIEVEAVKKLMTDELINIVEEETKKLNLLRETNDCK